MRNLTRFIALHLFAGLLSVSAADLYVAPRGSDSNPGTEAQPFASLEKARDAARTLISQAATSSKPITIWLRSGDYFRTNALELSRVDSGTAEAPVTWRSYKGERARLLGGFALKGFHPLVDEAVRQRAAAPARAHLLDIDLHALGIRDFGLMKSRGFGRPSAAAHCELFYDSKPMTLARWPNEGSFELIAGFPEEHAQPDGHGGKIGNLPDGFFYSGDRPRNWKTSDNIWVHGYWSWDWANSYERISQLDLDKKWVRTAAPYGQYGFRKGQRFYFLNIFEELDQPGEWFIDAESGHLYFWPPASLAPSDEVLLSICEEPLLRLKDVSNVAVHGLVLAATRGNGIEISGGNSNRVTGCLVQDIGDSGVVISAGANHAVAGCDIFDTGDGGVSLSGGDRQTLTGSGHSVENCHFARQGRWSKCYVPAILIGGVGSRASHNLIEDHPHCAILFSGNNHLLEFNEIHHIALETGDVGAIYTGRDYTFRGNRILYNYIHHTGGVGMGSMGVYMDDCVSGTEISGNIFYKVQRAAFLGGGRDHRVLNNIFVDCNYAVELDGRGLDKSPVWREMVNDTMRRSLKDIPLALYRERYPDMKSLDACYGAPDASPLEGSAFVGVPPENNLVATNICVGKWLNVAWHATGQMLKLQNNFTNAEACFAATLTDRARPTDFALKADCPAWKLGFQALPLDQIGLLPDDLRASIPK